MTVGPKMALQFTSYEMLEHLNYTFCIHICVNDRRPEDGVAVYQL
jgi:hypothetical protein